MGADRAQPARGPRAGPLLPLSPPPVPPTVRPGPPEEPPLHCQPERWGGPRGDRPPGGGGRTSRPPRRPAGASARRTPRLRGWPAGGPPMARRPRRCRDDHRCAPGPAAPARRSGPPVLTARPSVAASARTVGSRAAGAAPRSRWPGRSGPGPVRRAGRPTSDPAPPGPVPEFVAESPRPLRDQPARPIQPWTRPRPAHEGDRAECDGPHRSVPGSGGDEHPVHRGGEGELLFGPASGGRATGRSRPGRP